MSVFSHAGDQSERPTTHFRNLDGVDLVALPLVTFHLLRVQLPLSQEADLRKSSSVFTQISTKSSSALLPRQTIPD